MVVIWRTWVKSYIISFSLAISTFHRLLPLLTYLLTYRRHRNVIRNLKTKKIQKEFYIFLYLKILTFPIQDWGSHKPNLKIAQRYGEVSIFVVFYNFEEHNSLLLIRHCNLISKFVI